MGILCLSVFCYALLCVLSGFPIIMRGSGGLVALLLLSYGCLVAVGVLWLFPCGAVGWSAMCDCGIS